MAHSNDLLKMLRLCATQGGVVSICGNNHYKVIPPDKTKPIVYSSSTPGDVRSIHNIRGKLRRAGFIL